MTVQAIDIHTHIVPAEFLAYARKHGGAHWPSMAPTTATAWTNGGSRCRPGRAL